MSVIKVNNITNETGTAGPVFAGITTISSTGFMTLPAGPEEYRGGRGRGLFGGGTTPTNSNVIEYVTISTQSNATDFGDLTAARGEIGAFGSSTQGFFCGGLVNPSVVNTIEYVTISSTGNAFNFGELDATRWGGTGLSNSTRGIYGKGRNPSANPNADTFSIQRINLSSKGNASYFGDLISNVITSGACASPTRGLFGGGGAPNINSIEYITINTTGNGIDFGDLSISRRRLTGLSNSVRGIFGGGLPSPDATNVIEYVTIASLGDSIDFGDLTQTLNTLSACASPTRGIFAGGGNPSPTPTIVNVIQFITIATTGNATTFGNLTESKTISNSGCSDAHGGIGD